jgi:hypothetical protein
VEILDGGCSVFFRHFWERHGASNQNSMSKVICSEAITRAADRLMQILGGIGMTRDTVVERIFRDTRVFRIYDGLSEVHRWDRGVHRRWQDVTGKPGAHSCIFSMQPDPLESCSALGMIR